MRLLVRGEVTLRIMRKDMRVGREDVGYTML